LGKLFYLCNMKKVIVKFTDLSPETDKGFIGWRHKIPSDKQYKEIEKVDFGNKYGDKYRILEVVRGIGFYINNESDPLFLEFRKKYPLIKFRIEE